jgi:uncharacterized membrane protein YGL010W
MHGANSDRYHEMLECSMILLTTIATGIFSGLLRSVSALALVSFLICLSFAAAAITGPVSLVSFGLAIVGFNLGLITLFAGHLVLGAARPAA